MLDTIITHMRASGAAVSRASGAAVLIVVLAAVAFGPTASAQPQERRGPGLLGLAADLDADGDGVVSREEFDQGADTIFIELDRNGDGTLSEDELPRFRGPRPGHGPDRGHFGGAIVARGADADRDGEVTVAEWQTFLASLEVGAEGAISEDSLRAVLPGPPGMKRAPAEGREPRSAEPRPGRLTRVLDRDGDAIITLDDLNAVFAELDQDGNGALGAEELPRFRGHRGPPAR